MFNFEGIAEEDLVLFQENIDNRVLMRRAQAIVQQRKAARAARSVGGQTVRRGKHGRLIALPTANIDPSYYFSRMGEEREANAERDRRGENVWEDPDFLPWEMKKNPELRPIIEDAHKPMHMGGIVLPTAHNFKQAREVARTSTEKKD